MKRQAQNWEKIYAKGLSEKSLYLQNIYKYTENVCKELLKLNSKKTNSPIKNWDKDLNRHLNKDMQMVNKHVWKDAPHHMSTGKCNLKQWDTTTYLIEWPKFKHWQHQVLARMWSNRNSHHCWWERKTVQPLWKTVWQLITKLNIMLPYDCAPWYLQKWAENYVHTQNLHVDVYGSFIHNC